MALKCKIFIASEAHPTFLPQPSIRTANLETEVNQWLEQHPFISIEQMKQTATDIATKDFWAYQLTLSIIYHDDPDNYQTGKRT